MATSGDSSPFNQLLGRIMQTIRSVQRSVDGGVDSNILQRNISIIEAVQIQLVRIETLFSDHESRGINVTFLTQINRHMAVHLCHKRDNYAAAKIFLRGFHPCLGLFTWRGGLERHAQIQGNMY